MRREMICAICFFKHKQREKILLIQKKVLLIDTMIEILFCDGFLESICW